MNFQPAQECRLCHRLGAKMTRHHLIPRMVSGRSSVRRRLAGEKRQPAEIIMLCLPCHRQIHRVFSEKELALSANSLAKLASHPEVEKFVAWIRKQPVQTAFPCKK